MKTELVTTLKSQATKLLKRTKRRKGNGIDHLTRETAATYGTEPVFLEGLGHDMMLDPRWKVAADCILGGLKRENF